METGAELEINRRQEQLPSGEAGPSIQHRRTIVIMINFDLVCTRPPQSMICSCTNPKMRHICSKI